MSYTPYRPTLTGYTHMKLWTKKKLVNSAKTKPPIKTNLVKQTKIDYLFLIFLKKCCYCVSNK